MLLVGLPATYALHLSHFDLQQIWWDLKVTLRGSCRWSIWRCGFKIQMSSWSVWTTWAAVFKTVLLWKWKTILTIDLSFFIKLQASAEAKHWNVHYFLLSLTPDNVPSPALVSPKITVSIWHFLIKFEFWIFFRLVNNKISISYSGIYFLVGSDEHRF